MTKRRLAVLFALLGSSVAMGQNVDLVTLPNRSGVQLTIYNSEDLTLAKETRSITLKKGTNRLQFSWSGTLIDPTSVELRPMRHADQIEVADAVLLGQKPQHLIWNIESEFEGQVPVEVSYFTSGLTWRMDYVAVSNPEETEINLRGHVRVLNNSGEEYDNAEIRLIVGKINLVEKIAELARRRGIEPPKTKTAEHDELKYQAAHSWFSQAEAGGEASTANKPKRIIKEGLSEYFMFSVEGQETIANGWSKRMPAVRADQLKFDTVYRMRDYQYGPRPVRFFRWRNDEEHKLGGSPLPNGVIRVFRENGSDGLSYLGQQALNYAPIKAEVEVNLGPDDLVVYESRKTDTARFNFQFKDRKVIGWDERQGWIHAVRNYRAKPVRFELRLQWAGDVDVLPQAATTSIDFRTVETKLLVKPRDKAEYKTANTTHQGRNARQNRVQLHQAQ